MVIAQNATVEISILGAGALKAPKGKNFPIHQHSEWEIVYYRAGFIDCPIGNEVFKTRPGLVLLTPPGIPHAEVAPAGSVLLTPPGIPHAEVALTDYANYWLNLKVSGSPGWPRFCFDDLEHNLERLFRAIVQEWHGQAPGRAEMLELLSKQLGLALYRAFSTGQISEGEKMVGVAARLIEQQYTTPLTITKIAGQLGVSPAYLRLLFARYRGNNPLAYLQTLRLQHALQLISSSSLTLEAVARLSGYDSASHLSRHVKRETGKNPGEFRPGHPL
jgi:AraC-like DNA-binding protein